MFLDEFWIEAAKLFTFFLLSNIPMPSFVDIDLDPRIIRAAGKLGFASMTPVQEQVIPLALQGRHILAKARTGSGKTAAYCMPIIQKILSKETTGIEALVLVPTRELAEQVHRHIEDLTIYCAEKVKTVNIAVGDTNLASQM